MSFIEKICSSSEAQSNLCLNQLILDTLERTNSPLYLEPLRNQQGAPLSYYGKPMSLTTQETKGLRKISRLFNKLAQSGCAPCLSTPNLAIEWGRPDEMRLAFLPVGDTYVHAKEFSLSSPAESNDFASQEKVFVTGTCIFGKSGVTALTDTGKSLSPADPYLMQTGTIEEWGCISSLSFAETLHTYEVMSGLSRSNLLNQLNADKIYFNIPVAPYILYAKDAIARGLMRPELMNVWREQLQSRAKELAFYEQSLCNGTVIPVDPLYPYIDYICQESTSLDDLVTYLSEKDGWWKSYFAQVQVTQFSSIGYASYARVYYDLMGTENAPKTVIAVEDQTEMRLLLEVKKLIESGILPKPNQQGSIVGLYPFTPVIFPDENGIADATFLSERSNQPGAIDDIFNMSSHFASPLVTDKAIQAYGTLCQGTNPDRPTLPDLQIVAL